LRCAIVGAKRLEAAQEQTDAELAELEEVLTEREKQIEILEVEVEEERLRTHKLQARLMERESVARAPR